MRTFARACRIATDFCPQRSAVCYLSEQVFCFTKKEKKRRKSKMLNVEDIEFFTLITFSVYRAKVIPCFFHTLVFTNRVFYSFFYTVQLCIHLYQCVHMLSRRQQWQTLFLKVAVKCSIFGDRCNSDLFDLCVK